MMTQQWVVVEGFVRSFITLRPRFGTAGGISTIGPDHREDCRVAKLKIRRSPTRRYEAVYIFESALEDAAIAEKLEKLQSLLSLAEPAEIEHWGRRQLAYKIGRHETGYYVISRFTTAPATLPEFERALKLDEGIVRYLVTLYEHDLGAPALSDEDIALRRRVSDDDDDDDDEE